MTQIEPGCLTRDTQRGQWGPTGTPYPPSLAQITGRLTWNLMKDPSQHRVCSQLCFLLGLQPLYTISVFPVASFFLEGNRAQEKNSPGQCWVGKEKEIILRWVWGSSGVLVDPDKPRG